MIDYKKIYSDFVERMDKNLATAELAGEALVRMAGAFMEYNSLAVSKNIALTKEVARLSGSVDPTTNKPMTSTKAKDTAEASEVGEAYALAKAELENIDRISASLKYFQQGLQKEYSNS